MPFFLSASRTYALALAAVAAFAAFGLAGTCAGAEGPSPDHPGKAVYVKLCAECHGDNGEGVAGEYDEPLYGNRSLESLAGRIERTMPEDQEDLCVGEDAKSVAEYIYHAFYSAEARARISPPPIDVARLTVPQYQASVADLIGAFRRDYGKAVGDERGLKGRYFSTRNFRVKKDDDDKKKAEKEGRDTSKNGHFERLDGRIAFDFKEGSPDNETMDHVEFSIRWEGVLLAEETGTYEFVIRTRNGARLWVNEDDDDKTQVIDAWVAQGNDVREETGSIFLLAGRAYPLQLDYFKYKEKNASIELLWKPPHGVLEPVPARCLAPDHRPESFVVATPFPADDRSYGYERGTSVSKAWYQAVTQGAIETAGYVSEHLDELAGTKDDHPDRTLKTREFCARLAEMAFRRPLSDELRKEFVDQHFNENTATLEQSVKRSVLLVLTSPRFLYPELPGESRDKPDDFAVGARLALAMWDSLPDKTLLEAAKKGQLHTDEQVRAHAERMLHDPRTRAKLRGFFHHWLELDRAQDVTKDSKSFPDFDETVMADLRTSLNLFLDDVVWGGKSDYRDLLLSDSLYLNGRLAKLYGQAGKVKPDSGFQKVKLDSGQRAGVVTHPFLLTAFAYHNNTSPIHRGVFLTRNIVGMTLKPPPEAIEFVDSKFDPKLTMREKVTELTRSKACMACHSTINPLGFSLENYDAIGRWRAKERDKPIDATSAFITEEGDTVKLTGARDVAEYAAGSRSAHRAFIRQLFHHSVKQPMAAHGLDTLDDLQSSFEKTNFSIRDLLVEISAVAAERGLDKSSGAGKTVTVADK